MKTLAILAGLLASASAHATWQQLWVNGVDQAGTCVRKPSSNSPVTSVSSDDIRCGLGGGVGVSGVCTVPAGGTVTIEMHQQPGDRSCSGDAIGGNHDGPVIAYLSKVSDATTAKGSNWFKIFQNGLVRSDYWGTDVINANCGKQNIKIPADIAPGDYLLRAEVIALHVAGGAGGAQFYISCFQIRVTGGGSANPSGVSFPGAYSATDPGILFNLYSNPTSYTVPGPAVYGGGSSGGNPAPAPTSAQPIPSSTPPPATGGNIAKYGQCGGINWSGSGTCVSGATCVVVNDYYHQCQ